MDTLLRDLRCLDAHAHLGNLVFERSPARAIVHYEIGVRIGELSLPKSFDAGGVWIVEAPLAIANQAYATFALECEHRAATSSAGWMPTSSPHADRR